MAAPMLGLQIAGTLLQAQGAKQAGEAKQQELGYQATQFVQNAGQAQASGQIEALNQERNTSLMLSRARAVAAASGGGVTDAGVVKIMGDIAARGAYNANVARYQGDVRARDMRAQAAADIYAGDQAAQAGRINQAATLLSGGAGAISMGKKYGFDEAQGEE